MKTKQPILTGSIAAAAALAANRFVGADGNYASANGNAIGVTVEACSSGDMIPIDMLGIVLVCASGAISAGADVAVDTNGKAKALAALSVGVANTNGITVANPTGAGTIPAGETPVTSTGAQPSVALSITQGAVGGNITSVATPAGGALPSKKIGVALDAASTDGDIIRVLMK